MEITDLRGTVVTVNNGVGVIALNRTKKLNALNGDIMGDLFRLMDIFEESDEVRAIVVTGKGKAFCAGGDIGQEAEMNTVAAFHGGIEGNRLMLRMEKCRLPIIAAINGFCLGGGLEMALACDMRFASDRAKLGLTEVTLGVIPGSGGTQRLPRLIGASKAKMMMMSGQKYSAAEALELGVVDRVFPDEKLLDETVAFAETVAANPPLAVEYIKHAVNQGMECDLDRGLILESALFAQLYGTEDQTEAMNAFLERREHRPFTGR